VTIYHYPILEYLQKLWLTNKLIELYFTRYTVEQIQTLIFDSIISRPKVVTPIYCIFTCKKKVTRIILYLWNKMTLKY